MILLISGASHTGKTVLAQKLLESDGYPYLSIDHLKMGLIRSGHTSLKPESPDCDLTNYLWPIVSEITKTAIENGQNLIVEGCYIPFDWKRHFDKTYLGHIRYLCLIMAQAYIRRQWRDICFHAEDIERRLDASSFSPEIAIEENLYFLKGCIKYGLNYYLISKEYPNNLSMEMFSADFERQYCGNSKIDGFESVRKTNF